MAIIEISHTKIKITDEEISYIKEKLRMNATQNILIRNKHEAKKLSQKTVQLVEEGQRKRYNEALQDDDMMYLNSIYNSISMIEILKILLLKSRKYIYNKDLE